MNHKIKITAILGTTVGVAAMLGILAGCATLGEKPKPAMVPTERATVVFLEKYEFKRPPQNWAIMKNLEGGDFELGFLLLERGAFPTQTTFMYDDQPYGGSQDLEVRAKYYCTRFLFNSGIDLR